MHPDYDTSEVALTNYATGNPHFDCMKYSPDDVSYLCYLARDRDLESAEAALDRLRMLLTGNTFTPEEQWRIYRSAKLVELGSENVTLKAAAEDLLQVMERSRQLPEFPNEIELSQSTSNPALDDELRKIVAELHEIFGDRLISAYLVGSVADGSEVLTSDIDLHLLFRGAYSQYQRNAVLKLAEQLGKGMGRDLDLIPFAESDFTPWADVRTRLGGLEIFGRCPESLLKLPPMADYVRENMHRAYYYIARVRGLPEMLTYPVSPPDENDQFLGYTGRIHPDGTPSTKELAVVAGWISTALACRAGSCYIASKSASMAAYQQHVNDEWTPHLRDVFELVRETWGYRVPGEHDCQAKFTAICRRQVEFENHFLGRYCEYLNQECAGAEPAHAAVAAKRLAVIYPGPGAEPQPPLLVPTWQLKAPIRNPDPKLISVDELIVKIPSLRTIGEAAVREAYHRFDEYGVVIFDCKDSDDRKKDLLALQHYFGDIVFHPRSDETGITSVRNQFKPQANFVATTNVLQTPHTDGSFLEKPPGIVALQTEICGLCGGESTLVFGDSLLKHLREKYPDEVEKLFRPDAYTVQRDADWVKRPVFWDEGGRTQFAYRCGNGETLTIPPWSRKLFYAVYEYANSSANQLRFRLPSNHIMVVDNRRNLHGRTGWPSDTVRSLNRLWLNGESAHPLYPGVGIK